MIVPFGVKPPPKVPWPGPVPAPGTSYVVMTPFLSRKKGVITTYDVPGAGTGPGQGTFGGGFTPNGTIMGNYIDADDLSHGFVLDKNGVFTTFDAPSAGTGPFQGTIPFGINTSGAITGWYVDGTDVNHGFVRDKQ